MRGLAKIVTMACIGLTLASPLKAQLTRAEKERIAYNIFCELFNPENVSRYKRLYYDTHELVYAVYIDERTVPIIGDQTYIGFDCDATEDPTPENNTPVKENTPAGYYHNSTAPDSLGIRYNIINFLRGKVDEAIGAEQSTWGAIKSLFKK